MTLFSSVACRSVRATCSPDVERLGWVQGRRLGDPPTASAFRRLQLMVLPLWQEAPRQGGNKS